MLNSGMFVQAEVALVENPYAEVGQVVGRSQVDADLVSVQWPGFPEPVWEIDWTLREVDGHPFPAPSPDAVDLAADRAGV